MSPLKYKKTTKLSEKMQTHYWDRKDHPETVL